MTGVQTCALPILEIPEAMNVLCERLLPSIPILVDAFDIPETLLGAIAG